MGHFKYRGYASGIDPEIVEFEDDYLPDAKERAVNWFLERIFERRNKGLPDPNEVQLNDSIKDLMGVSEPSQHGVVLSFVADTRDLQLAFAIMGEEDKYYLKQAREQEEYILSSYE